MTEEEKRWSKGEDPFESVRDNNLGLEVYFNHMVDILNNYESRVKELEQAIARYQQGRTVLMPKELTAENGAKGLLMDEFFEESKQDCPECYGDGCGDCDGEGSQTVRIPVSWATIKKIYKMCVDNLSVRVSK